MKNFCLCLIVLIGFSFNVQGTSKFLEPLNLNVFCNGFLFNAIPHPSDDNLFIGCIEEKGTIFGCDAENFVFDPITVKCVDPKLITITTESQTTPTTNRITTTSNNSTTVPQSTTTTSSGSIFVRFSCPSSGIGLIPHKTDCTRYYECIRGIASPRTCGTAGYHYDVITKQCQPADVATCGNTIRCF
ncbi:unnamed protein product [Chironomus riparius]|uniref:Chitin-binding type-2 domain-containing protein n=1 Tax=Chironomus riparius TaxID=315576 RepID=A0A9N9S6H7_9DIPT|nr:unnamed protein product [Chironomus riparius]